MAKNTDNLLKLTKEQAREFGRRGGCEKARRSRQKKDNIRTLSQTALDNVTQADKDAIVKAVINYAKRGSTQHISMLADMLGEALTKQVSSDVTVRFESEEDFSK